MLHIPSSTAGDQFDLPYSICNELYLHDLSGHRLQLSIHPKYLVCVHRTTIELSQLFPQTILYSCIKSIAKSNICEKKSYAVRLLEKSKTETDLQLE